MDTRTSGTHGAGNHVSFRATCGREIRVGHLALGGARHPAQRISLDISPSPGTYDGTRAALTAGEARRLATAPLTQAAACGGARASTRSPGRGRGRADAMIDSRQAMSH